jgi:small ligand-binding sensory domain FIST
MATEQGAADATAFASVVEAGSWDQALGRALGEAGDALSTTPDLVLLFASPAYRNAFPHMAAVVQERTGTGVLAGCSGGGVIGPAREVEGRPALSLLAASLPGGVLHAVHVTQPFIAAAADAADWQRLTGAAPADVNGWLVLADPFTVDTEALLTGLTRAYPGAPVIGGLASGDPRTRLTHLFFNGDVYTEGAVLVAIGGAYTVRTVVSQGAEPIGEPWTVTAAHDNLLESVGGRPAYEVLAETFHALPPDVQERARTNLLIGLAMNEYRDEYRRGDYLIRNLLGVDEQSGALAIGAYPRVGQTVQFQIRDADAADAELRDLLTGERAALDGAEPVAALLCACNGRGVGLFGAPDHDARALAEALGPVPAAGFFCNGEIGPVGGTPYMHGFTASIGLIVPVARRA